MSKISSKISSVDQEKFQAFLQQILRNVKTQEDPRVLDAYRRLFRKSVPFSMRSYVAAHLAHTHCRAGATAGSTRRTGAREGIRTGSAHAPASAARARDFERKARDYPALCPGTPRASSSVLEKIGTSIRATSSPCSCSAPMLHASTSAPFASSTTIPLSKSFRVRQKRLSPV